jgi:hypothetical protein
VYDKSPLFEPIVIAVGSDLCVTVVRLYYFSAGGCPLAETLAQGGLKVLLVERGTATLPASVKNSKDVWDAVSFDIARGLFG